MKHIRTIQVPAKEKQVIDKVTCDLCGNKIEYKRFSAEEAIVKHRTGDSYPEGGSGEEISIDICGSCFDGKLILWLHSQGIEPRTEEWEW